MNFGPGRPEGFSRDDRLRKRREFEECYASGVRVSGRFIQVFLRAASGESARTRLGISVPRRVGRAASRNRVRRRLREIFRRNRGLFGAATVSVVVNARPSAAQASFQDLSADYAASIGRALPRLPRP